MSTIRNRALAFLRVVSDEKNVPHDAVRGFAVEALRVMAPDSAPWRKAIEVLEGGPLRLRRAVDLAGLVLEDASLDHFPEEPAAPGDLGARFPEAEEEIRAMKEDGDVAPSRAPVTTITIRWTRAPEILDAALATMGAGLAELSSDWRGPAAALAETIVAAAEGDSVDLPNGLGVARATTGGGGAA